MYIKNDEFSGLIMIYTNNHSRYTLLKQKYHANNINTIRINFKSTSDKDVS